MSRNKLYNQSYFCKRIIEEGFNIIRLNIPYAKDDLRKWTIVVNKQHIEYKHNIVITCFKDEETKEFSFKFQGQKFEDFILPTLSMKLIISILKKTTETSTITEGTEND
jgi:hypothetical protein